MAQIESAIVAQDGQRLSRSAHALKSRSANIGAEGLSALYRQLEHCGRESRIDQARALLDDLKGAHGRVVARARDLLTEAA